MTNIEPWGQELADMGQLNSILIEGAVFGDMEQTETYSMFILRSQWRKNEEVKVRCLVQRTVRKKRLDLLESGRYVRVVGRLFERDGLCILCDHIETKDD